MTSLRTIFVWTATRIAHGTEISKRNAAAPWRATPLSLLHISVVLYIYYILVVHSTHFKRKTIDPSIMPLTPPVNAPPKGVETAPHSTLVSATGFECTVLPPANTLSVRVVAIVVLPQRVLIFCNRDSRLTHLLLLNRVRCCRSCYKKADNDELFL